MIPQIIHQVWEGKTERLPKQFIQFAETWKEHHPNWQYEFWNKKRMDAFVRKYYPEFADIYFGYGYDVQRWNAIRYLILYKTGGVYVDFDCECLKPMDAHLQGKTCCFGLEPEEYAKMYRQPFIISNAWIASESNHPFLKKIIETLPKINSTATDKINVVVETTGSIMLTNVYHRYPCSFEKACNRRIPFLRVQAPILFRRFSQCVRPPSHEQNRERYNRVGAGSV